MPDAGRHQAPASTPSLQPHSPARQKQATIGPDQRAPDPSPPNPLPTSDDDRRKIDKRKGCHWTAKGTPGVRASHPRWIAPPEGFAKFNVDAVVPKNTGGGALGVVCRSAGGVFLGASALVVAGISDPAILEALACREALVLAEDFNIQKMVVAVSKSLTTFMVTSEVAIVW
ncbi:hypothetical protein QYE76_019794 [Lolium multiflorum]|uniref:RNase H type-1 domain-containing protein n=1 Tax=Lolium multiflorum TaxID=4521 RepID=A0AAD8R5S1_LOLMU|nr:hypothetical protein QYE76_019794 [Lolium multiflorum]